MEAELYDVVESTYHSLPDDAGFYAATAMTTSAVTAKYVEEFGFESVDSDSVLED